MDFRDRVAGAPGVGLNNGFKEIHRGIVLIVGCRTRIQIREWRSPDIEHIGSAHDAPSAELVKAVAQRWILDLRQPKSSTPGDANA